MFVESVESRESRVERRSKAEGGGRRAEGFVIRHSSFVNSPCTLPLPPRGACAAGRLRLGITLTEVLISLGILTIGLLGVAALFPVGSYYMQKGEIADRGSALAQSAFNDAITRGMLNPANWLMYESVSSPATAQTYQTFGRSFQSGLAKQLATNLSMGWTKPVQNQVTNAKFGSAYVIDPLGTDGSRGSQKASGAWTQTLVVQQFPFNAQFSYGSLANWAPWKWIGAPTVGPVDPHWAVVRLTVPGPGGVPQSAQVADATFRSADDLAVDVPAKSNATSVQAWETDTSTGNALTRKSRGDYSWIATVVPPSSEARNALASDPSAYEYEVSVAVMYKRVIDSFGTAPITPMERLVNAQVISSGLNGGQLLLSQPSTDLDISGKLTPDPFGALKVGNWVVVCGPHPNSTDDLNRFFFRWYRVLAIEGKDTKLDSYGNVTTDNTQPQRRRVSLRGPQWPWQPAPSANLADYSNLSNDLCVAIIPSVVAVESKTIRLDASSLSSGGSASTTGTTPPGGGGGGFW